MPSRIAAYTADMGISARIIRALSVLALAGLVLSLPMVAGCGASQGPSAAMSLRRVVLYQNGLGYFERSGRIGEETLALRFGAHEVDDVLSTLTVLDPDGQQTVVSASVPQRRPEESDDDVVTLDLRLPERRERDLVLTYAVPTPAWRAAYRVVLPEGEGEGEALFQIWAFVHNASPEDWNHVELALATGAPISYRVDLRTPEFVARPDASGHMSAPTVTGTVVAEASRGEADGDGVPDINDLCPGEPEDRDGFQDSDGCPDLDNDRDMVADASDQCPGDPETYNGMEDEDGCPDRGTVIVEEMRIEILDQIYFERGRSRISPQSQPIVDAIAATLNGNPQITSVEVEGHASDDESDGFALSSERASAVRQVLITRGVAASRLTIRPYGASRPIAEGTTASARERNRRVGFHIVATADGGSFAQGGAGGAPRAATAAPSPPSPPRAQVTVDTLARSSSSAATPVVVEGTTRYDVAAPVTIPAHSSSLVTILSERVRGEAILLFRPDPAAPGSELHPFHAARIATPRTTTLIPGPVAIYAGGSFAGQGLVESLHEGEVATLPYSLDGSTRIERIDESAREPSRLVAIARGVITVEDRSIRRTRYAIRPGDHAPARIFVRHARAFGHTPRGLPAGTEETDTALLIPTGIEAGTPSELVIEEYTPVRRQIAMLGDLRAPIRPYVEATGELPAELAARLGDALDRRMRLGELEERIASLRERIGDASQRSAELRENLRALGTRASATRTTLEQRLRDASAEVERLSRELSDLQAQAADARAQLSEAIAALSLEERRDEETPRVSAPEASR